jgi:hypothetical protein
MMLPTVHINGTSREELVRQQVETGQALRIALEKLAAAAPHPRDYYINKNPRAYQVARAEHERRCGLLRDILRETEEIAEAIDAVTPG